MPFRHAAHPAHAARRNIANTRTLRMAISLAVVTAAIAGGTVPAHAASIAYGTVLVSGSQWAGADAGLGDLNVYSNGTGGQDRSGTFGTQYECTELVQRWAHYKWGEPDTWPVRSAADMWNAGPTLPVALAQNPNGGASPPAFGDIIVYAATSGDPTGHVGVVAGVSATSVTVVQQNFTVNGTPTGEWTQSLSGTTVPPLGGSPVLGWLRRRPRGCPGRPTPSRGECVVAEHGDDARRFDADRFLAGTGQLPL